MLIHLLYQKQSRLVVEYPNDGVALASPVSTHRALSEESSASSMPPQCLQKREPAFPPRVADCLLLRDFSSSRKAEVGAVRHEWWLARIERQN